MGGGGQERFETLRACLQAVGADVRVVIRLREGAILLEATNNRQRLELYREDVAPHRPGGGTEMDFEEMTQTF